MCRMVFCMLQNLEIYNLNLMVGLYVFGCEQLLLSSIVQVCDYICSLCFRLYLGP